MTWRSFLLVFGFCLLAAVSVQAADPWHRSEWQARSMVEIPRPSTEAGNVQLVEYPE